MHIAQLLLRHEFANEIDTRLEAGTLDFLQLRQAQGLLEVSDATGEITLQGTPVVNERYRQEASVFAPLPMIGIDAWFSLTPRWALGTKISLVGGSYQDISAEVLETVIRSRYKFNRYLSGYIGISYFNADVTIDEADLRTDVAYGFDGLYLGLGVSF